jgi:hypothetical protein
MGIRARRGAHREEDEEKRECVARELLERRSVNPRGIGFRYILNGVSIEQGGASRLRSSGGYRTVLMEPRGALPRKCLFIVPQFILLVKI